MKSVVSMAIAELAESHAEKRAVTMLQARKDRRTEFLRTTGGGEGGQAYPQENTPSRIHHAHCRLFSETVLSRDGCALAQEHAHRGGAHDGESGPAKDTDHERIYAISHDAFIAREQNHQKNEWRRERPVDDR